jgi:hypothetical protein
MKIKITLFAILFSFISISQTTWKDLGTFNNFPGTIESQLKIKENGTPVYAYIDISGDPGIVLIQEWTGTTWNSLPDLNPGFSSVFDLKLVINGNTLYLGVGDFGTGYSVYKFDGSTGNELGGGSIPNSGDFAPASVRLSCGQDEDDLTLSHGTDGNTFKMHRYNGSAWEDSFGNEINMTMGSTYTASYTDHVMFDNSDKTFVLMNQNEGNNSLMTYYVNQGDGGTVADSVRNGSDLGFITNNPGKIRIDGNPTTPNGPSIAYIGNDNEDFIEVKNINDSDPNQYIDIPGYQEPTFTNFSEFDMTTDNLNQVNIAFINTLNKNKAVFFDGTSWIEMNPEIDATDALIFVDMEIFQASNKPYVMYETATGSGVKVFNTPPQFNSISTITHLCETASPSSVGIVSDIQFNDVDHDSIYIVSVTSDNQSIVANGDLTFNRISSYDYNSPANNFEISAKPVTNATGSVIISVMFSDGFQSVTKTFNLDVNTLPTVNAGVDQDICDGSSTTLVGSGSATSYSWNLGVTNNVSFTPITSNTYTVIGTDANGCANSANMTLTLLNSPVYVSSATTDVDCFGMANGTITLTGLTPANNYDIDLGFGSSTYSSTTGGDVNITGLNGGNYTVDITDNSTFCNYVGGTESIIEPMQLTYTSSFSPLTICEGENATLEHMDGAFGGSPTYNYTWDGGVIDASPFTPPVGNNTYNLTVVDMNGCSIIESFDINVNAAPPTFTVTPTNPTSCGGTDGELSIDGLLASTMYDVSYDNPSTISQSSVSTDATGSILLNGLSAGSYTNFVIEDASVLCQTTLAGPVTLSDPAGPNVDPINDQSICADSDFSLISFSGTSGAVFNWTNDNTTIGLAASGTGAIPTFTGLNSGNSSEIANITVTPTLGGCTGTSETFTLTVNPLDDAGFTYSNTTFCEDETASPTVNINTAGGAFTYSTVSGGTTLMLNSSGGQIGLGFSDVGVYDVTYTTNGTCPMGHTEQISINALPTLTNTQPTVQYCAESGDISLDGIFIPVGGTYSGNYIDNNFIRTNNLTATNTNYTYTYTDGFGCTNTDATGSLEILAAPRVDASTIAHTACGTNNGSITGINIVDGQAPYTLYWSNGVTTADNSNLEPRTYYLNITDANNCYAMDVFTVSSFEIALTGTTNDVSCANLNDGSIDLTVSGSNGPYTYYWSNGATTEDIDNLDAGQYEVFVHSADGCMSTMSFNVNGPAPLTSSFTTTNPTNCNVADGIIVSNALGGNGTYNHTWTDATGTTIGSTNTLNSLSPGTYSVDITDGNNCLITKHVSISNPSGPTITVENIENSNCNLDGAVTVNIDSPNTISSTTWSNGETTQNISGLSSGVYSLVVEDNLGCESSINAIINENIPNFTEICIVTVDTNTNTNLIVWEKPISSDIDYFILYRESSVAGQYLVVDSIDYNDESQYTDLVAYPQYRSWRYKLVTVNNCGVNSFKSPEHKTIHITYSESTSGTYNISWDQYEGFTYSTFDLYRNTAANGWELIQTLPSTTFAYTDTPASTEGLDYIISITPPSTCTSTFRAQDHNASRSNKSSNIAAPGAGTGEIDDSGVNEYTNLDFSIYPNPSSGVFNVSINTKSTNDYIVNIYDIKGSIVKTLSETNSTFVFDINELESGSYFIEVNAENGIIRQHIIKN